LLPDPANFTIRLRYDFNGNGTEEISDLVYVERYWFQVREGDPEWPQAQYADINGDGVVDTIDLILILEYLLQ
jgi:hypothetical protein